MIMSQNRKAKKFVQHIMWGSWLEKLPSDYSFIAMLLEL